MIVAMDRNRGIGKDNAMPWHLPEDFEWFKKMTMRKPVVMGRKTYESIGRPLPGRTNIVVTRDKTWAAEGVNVCHSIDDVLEVFSKVPELVFIGGQTIYEQVHEKANFLYLTEVKGSFNCDAFFPELESDWEKIYHHEFRKDDKNPYDMNFYMFSRE